MINKKKINFIIIGPEKTGSTSLASTLNNTAEISVYHDEIDIFQDPIYKNTKKTSEFLDKLIFDNKKILGIKRPNLIHQKNVPNRIFKYNKDIKLIITIRKPYERFISHYLHLTRYNLLPLKNIIKILNYDKSFIKKYPRTTELINGMYYHKNYLTYLKKFPKKNILLLNFDNQNKKNLTIKINNFFNTNLKIKNILFINQGTYNYADIFLHKILNAIRLKKRTTNKKSTTIIFMKRTNLIRKIFLKFFYLILKINIVNININIEDNLITKIKKKYYKEYDKIIKLVD